jgi:SAM-dependent methyltransferase
MMGGRTLGARWRELIDAQHRMPSGLLGRAIAERMVRQHAPETRWTLELLELRPTDLVLELGFGAGRGLELAAGQAPRGWLLGLDRSATMVQAAARRNRARLGEGRIALAQADLEAPPLTGGRFDKIFSIHTFYFWSDPERLSAELAGLLAPGGTLAITLATAQQSASGGWDFWPVHQRALDVVAALSRRGFGYVELRHGPNSRRYNNVAIVVKGGT